MFLSSALFATAFSTLAKGAVLGKRSLSGEATYYGGNLAGGACSFSTYTLPSGIFGTALSDSNWDNSGNCGACVSVTGPSGNSITAMIVDECPGCGLNHLDLFPDAFAELANPTVGVIDVTWDYIDCPITSALSVHNKEGVSAYWFSMQVVNANEAVASLDVSTDGGSTWQTTTRQSYNFFENASGFGTTTVDVKVTSVNGDVVIVNDVTVSASVSKTASSNFGSSGAAASSVAAIVSSTSTSAAPVEPTTTSKTPVAVPTTSETPVATTTSYPVPTSSRRARVLLRRQLPSLPLLSQHTQQQLLLALSPRQNRLWLRLPPQPPYHLILPVLRKRSLSPLIPARPRSTTSTVLPSDAWMSELHSM